MSTQSRTKLRIQAVGVSLAMLLVVAGGQASAQEMFKLSGDLYRASSQTYTVSMNGAPALPKREAPVQPNAAPDLQASMLEYPALPASGGTKEAAKETRESVLQQIAALGGTFGKGLKAASSRCTDWQSGVGFDQPWMGPDAPLNRACVFQFDLPSK